MGVNVASLSSQAIGMVPQSFDWGDVFRREEER